MKCFQWILVILASAQLAYPGVLYVEGEPMMPDFSNDFENPTTLTLNIGEQEIAGSIFDDDPDFFTLIVPEGTQLSGIVLLGYGHRLASNVSFIGYQRGATLDREPSNLGAGDLTHTLFGSDELNDPILTGASRPAGSYAFWLNETSTSGAGYRLNFITTAIPEPSVTALCLVTLTITTFRRNKLS